MCRRKEIVWQAENNVYKNERNQDEKKENKNPDHKTSTGLLIPSRNK